MSERTSESAAPPDAADVVVVGAGPAGLAAAVSAAKHGARTMLLDAERLAGGQYLRQPEAPDVQPARHRRRADQLLRRAQAAGVELCLNHRVVAARVDGGLPVLQVMHERSLREVPAAALVLATGAHDRVVPFPGWDLPGVVTAGGAQALLKGQGVLIGRRVLVAGTGPFLLAVAGGLAAAGAEVVAVAEAGDPVRWGRELPAVLRAPAKLAEAAGYFATLGRRRVRLWRRTAVTAIEPYGEGLRATVDRIDERWRIRPGGRRHVDVDAVCVGYGFTPAVELAVALGCPTRIDPRDGSLVVSVDSRQRCDVPRVFAAGEMTGVGGADLAMTEGSIAGLGAATLARTGHAEPPARDAMEPLLRRRDALKPLLRQRRRERRFADALHAVYPMQDGWLEWLDDGSLLCRCEEVTVGQARAAITDFGADDLRSLRLLSRVGMGRCQGRICGWPASQLLAAAGAAAPDLAAFANRPLTHPVPLRALAEEHEGGQAS